MYSTAQCCIEELSASCTVQLSRLHYNSKYSAVQSKSAKNPLNVCPRMVLGTIQRVFIERAFLPFPCSPTLLTPGKKLKLSRNCLNIGLNSGDYCEIGDINHLYCLLNPMAKTIILL